MDELLFRSKLYDLIPVSDNREDARFAGLNIFYRLILSAFILLCCNTSLMAQSDTGDKAGPETNLYKATENYYGADDLLVHGKIYYQDFPLAEGHPYFLDKDWLPGIIFIKGKTFSGLEIKYDLDMDRVVLNTRDKKGAFVDLMLNSVVIDSLYIKDHFFISTRIMDASADRVSFLEIVNRNEPMMLIRHEKEFLDDYSDRHPHGWYRDPTRKLFIYSHGALADVTGKGAFLKYFEPQKKNIKQYLKKNKIRYKKASQRQLFDLMEYCSQVGG